MASVVVAVLPGAPEGEELPPVLAAVADALRAVPQMKDGQLIVAIGSRADAILSAAEPAG